MIRKLFPALALLLANPAMARTPVVPPDLEGKVYSIDYLHDMQEPALWQAKALGHFESRYRLTISSGHCQTYSIRIDIKPNGRAFGVAKKWNHCGRSEFYDQRDFRLTTEQVHQLKVALADAQLWRIYPQIFNAPKDDICLHTSIDSFERLDNSGYGLAQADTCGWPDKIAAAADQIVSLAGGYTELQHLQ